MKKGLGSVLLSVAFTAIGLSAGWYAARQTGGGGGGGHEGHEGHDHGGPAREGGHEGHVHLSPQALRNLGVTIAELEMTDYRRTIAVPAVVEDSPQGLRPVVAPFGGKVQVVAALPGALVPDGAVLLTIVRDAIAPPELRLTEELFQPANETFHSAVGDLRKSVRNLELVKTELERLQKFAETGTQDGLPIVPRKNMIELQYEQARSEKEVATLRAELSRHGVSADQIADIEAGKAAPGIGQRLWHQVLVQSGLWTAEAEIVHAALPADLKDLPVTHALLGELVATGRLGAEVAEWIAGTPGAKSRFREVAALLLSGTSLAGLRALHDAGALEPVIAVRAPAGPGDWDVREVAVRPGEHVEAGARVLSLHNAREMVLRAEAAGGDAAALVAALDEQGGVEAKPLVAGSGPDLRGLRVLYLKNEETDRGTVGFLRAANEPQSVRDEGGRFRTWKLRAGLRYMVHLPVETLKGVYVVPAGAVLEEGADRIVFVQDGDDFKEAKVVVRFQNHEVAVLDGKGSEVFPGDPVVQQGAFALGLALKAGKGGAVDPHAGHNH